jgi:hypothetical protein
MNVIPCASWKLKYENHGMCDQVAGSAVSDVVAIGMSRDDMM